MCIKKLLMCSQGQSYVSVVQMFHSCPAEHFRSLQLKTFKKTLIKG